MNKKYEDTGINSYFSIQSLDDYSLINNTEILHPWFSIVILNKFQGEIGVDQHTVPCNGAMVVFLSPGQYFSISKANAPEGYIISFNKEFYCIEYHDSEVSCNGLLFVNSFQLVKFYLDEQQQQIYNNTAREIFAEFENDDKLLAEMLKTLLKNLLIRSSRLFRTQIMGSEVEDANIDFFRKFNSLVDKHFLTLKQVDAYAELIGITASSLTKKMLKYGIDSPSRIIKNRIITEAKRLLIYSGKTVKEIAFSLGYDDQHYFSRLFTKETGVSPTEYKKQLTKF